MIENNHKTIPNILIVDDEKHIRSILSEILVSLGYKVKAVENGRKALLEIKRNSFDIVISDLMMPEISGLQLLEQVKAIAPEIVVIIMTGFGTIPTAIDAMKKDAYEYILKPFKLEELVYTVKRGIEKRMLEKSNVKLKEAIALLQLNEAIASGIEEEKILKIIIDATLREIDADVVTYLLKNEESKKFETRLKHSREKKYFGKLLGEVVSKEADKFLNKDKVFLLDKNGLKEYFGGIPYLKDVVSFISIPLKIKGKVVGAINAYSFTKGHHFTEGQCKSAAIIAGRTADVIDNAQLYESVHKTFKETIKSFAYALEAKDKYTQGHSEKVTLYSELICEALKIPKEETEKIILAAQLHDIGKIGIKEELLNKPGKLTLKEYEIIKTHPIMGVHILKPLHFLKDTLPIIQNHHERFDGNGYPFGIKGENIPIGARIISVGDAYEAMISNRPYRKGLLYENIIEELKKCAGTQFDPEIVIVFIKILKKRHKGKKK